VDNATQHKFATEIPFRAKLEKEVTQMKTDTGDSKYKFLLIVN